VPEIAEAWSLGSAVEWILVSIPVVVLAVVLFSSPRPSIHELRHAEL